MNTSNPNRTLGCGYLDENDSIFKSEGLTILKKSSNLVNCMATHLTAIGVEEYTSDVTLDDGSGGEIIDEPISEED